jgi:hypothetical protein
VDEGERTEEGDTGRRRNGEEKRKTHKRDGVRGMKEKERESQSRIVSAHRKTKDAKKSTLFIMGPSRVFCDAFIFFLFYRMEGR